MSKPTFEQRRRLRMKVEALANEMVNCETCGKPIQDKLSEEQKMMVWEKMFYAKLILCTAILAAGKEG